jgi:hypothetical protein
MYSWHIGTQSPNYTIGLPHFRTITHRNNYIPKFNFLCYAHNEILFYLFKHGWKRS